MRWESVRWRHPDKLRNTTLIGVNCTLRAGDEHYGSHRPSGCTGSQFSFEYNSEGVRWLIYREESVSKTNRGGLKDMKKEWKIVWGKTNADKRRCPVRIIEKYMSILLLTGSKPNLYLQLMHKTKPNCWYSTVPIDINALLKVVGIMLRDASLDGCFTNHSWRRTCTTHLFQAGECTKIVTEIMGHICRATETGGRPPVVRSTKFMPPSEAYGHFRLSNRFFPPNQEGWWRCTGFE